MPAKLHVEVEVTKKGDLILKGLGKDLKDVEGHMKKVSKAAGLMATSLKVAIAYIASKKIKEAITAWSQLAGEMEAAEKLFEHATRITGKHTEEFYRNSLKYAVELQKATGIHRKSIEQGMRLLVTFDEVNMNIMPRVTKAMVEYSFFTGVSMHAAAKAIGKASMGLLGDLKRVGVQVREETYHTKGFIGILEELERQMQGFAVEYRQTTAGTWLALKTAMTDARIAAGDFFNVFLVKMHLLDSFIEGVQKTTKYLKELKDLVEGWAEEKGLIEPEGPKRRYIDIGPPRDIVISKLEYYMRQLGAFFTHLGGFTKDQLKGPFFRFDKDTQKNLTRGFQTAWIDFLVKGKADWGKLMESMERTFLDKFISKLWEERFSAKFISPSIKMGDVLSLGMAGYGAYQSGDAAQGALMGALTLGSITQGPGGALLGALGGGVFGAAGFSTKKRPHIELLWEVIDGEVKLMAETWKNTPRSKEVIQASEDALNAQLNLYRQLKFMAAEKGMEVIMPSAFKTGGLPEDPLERLLNLNRNLQKYQELFPELEDYWKRLPVEMKVWYGYTGDFKKWTPAQQIKNVVNEFFDYAGEKIEKVSNLLADSLGQALISSLNSGDFHTFQLGFRQGLFNTMLEAFTSAFSNRYMMSKFGSLGSMTDIIHSYSLGNIGEGEAIGGISSIFAQTASIFEQMRPIWEEINSGIQDLVIKMGLNTDALKDSISKEMSRVDTINAMIRQLTFGAGGAMSYSQFQSEYTKLLGGAGTERGLSDFISFVSGEYAPFMSEYSGNYQKTLASIVGNLEGLGAGAKGNVTDLLWDIYQALGGKANSLPDALALIEQGIGGDAEKGLGKLIDELELDPNIYVASPTVNVSPPEVTVNVEVPTGTELNLATSHPEFASFVTGPRTGGIMTSGAGYIYIKTTGGQTALLDPSTGEIIDYVTVRL